MLKTNPIQIVNFGFLFIQYCFMQYKTVFLLLARIFYSAILRRSQYMFIRTTAGAPMPQHNTGSYKFIN